MLTYIHTYDLGEVFFYWTRLDRCCITPKPVFRTGYELGIGSNTDIHLDRA